MSTRKKQSPAEKKWAQIREIVGLCALTAMEPGMDFSFRVTKPLPPYPPFGKQYIGRIGPKTTITLKIFPAKKRSRSPKR